MSEDDVRDVRQLVADPKNRRTHPERNLAMMRESLETVGAARSIVIDEDDLVLAGNGVAAAALAAGITNVRIIDATGDELIAVRRRGLTAEQKRALALFDNRTAELAEWNFDQLADDKSGGLSLQPFWTPEEEARLLGARPKDGLTDPDSVPSIRATEIQRGDLFELGAHRLLCGDATAATDVARVLGADTPFLMVTDPPYGVNYDPKWREEAAARGAIAFGATRLGVVANDDRHDWTEAWALFTGTVAYVWHAGLRTGEVAAHLSSASLIVRSQIIWRKRSFVISRGHYHGQHEPCWYAVRKGCSARWCGDHSQSTVWDIDSVGMSHMKGEDTETPHGTQKPVECILRPLRNHDAAQLYDPFLGSGTAVIAAEQLGRACRGIEIEPSYCQVIIDRWESFAGQKARKV